MAQGELAVDPLSLADFHQTLQGRLDEAMTALVRVDPSLGLHAPRPALGGFEDAANTAERYERLRNEFAEQVHRLVSAIVAAKAATNIILTKFESVEELNTAIVRDTLRPVVEELLHGHGSADAR